MKTAITSGGRGNGRNDNSAPKNARPDPPRNPRGPLEDCEDDGGRCRTMDRTRRRRDRDAATTRRQRAGEEQRPAGPFPLGPVPTWPVPTWPVPTWPRSHLGPSPLGPISHFSPLPFGPVRTGPVLTWTRSHLGPFPRRAGAYRQRAGEKQLLALVVDEERREEVGAHFAPPHLVVSHPKYCSPSRAHAAQQTHKHTNTQPREGAHALTLAPGCRRRARLQRPPARRPRRRRRRSRAGASAA